MVDSEKMVKVSVTLCSQLHFTYKLLASASVFGWPDLNHLSWVLALIVFKYSKLVKDFALSGQDKAS